MSTTERLNALIAAAEKATPGPWVLRQGEYVVPIEHEKRPIGGASDPIVDKDKYAQWIVRIPSTHRHRPDYEQRGNADLIAACSPEVVIALCRVALAAQGDRGIINPSKLYDALAALEAAK